MKARRKLGVEFARMRSDLKRARDCFGGVRILCETNPQCASADPAIAVLMNTLAAIRVLALEAEISLGAAERKGHETLYPPRY